jgi:hypothetical protein
MRHQPENIPFAVANPRNVFDRAIWICFGNGLAPVVRVTQNHLFIGVQLMQRLRVGKKTAFTMRHGQAQKCAFRTAVRKWRVIYLNARSDHVTNKPKRAVSHQRARQKTGFTQDLKPVARPEHELAGARVANHCFHYGRKPRDGSTAKVVAVCESAGQHDGIEIIERSFLVPNVFGLQAIKPINRPDTVLVAIGTGKLNDGELHGDFNASPRLRVAPRDNHSPRDTRE